MVADSAGFNRGTVSIWKKRAQEGIDIVPRREILDKICAYFGCTETDLLTDKEKQLAVADELDEYLDMLRSRPECRVLLKTALGATKDEVEENVRFIEALRQARDD